MKKMKKMLTIEKPNAPSCVSAVIEDIDWSCASRARNKNALF